MPKGPAVCVTGHRPPELPGGYQGSEKINEFMRAVVVEFYNQGYRTFISGGALGADQIFADAVIVVKAAHPDIELIIARPFPSQSCKWPESSQKKFDKICSMADTVIDVSPDPYHPAKMQARNEWMVDHSQCIIALWNGKEHGGTWNCLQYAQKTINPIYHIHPNTLEVIIR